MVKINDVNDDNEATTTHTGSKEDKVDVDTISVDDVVVPLVQLNVQLKRVHGDACMTVDRGQAGIYFRRNA